MQNVKKNLMSLPSYDYAVYLLSMRLQSSGELALKMKRKGYGKSETSDAIQRLTDLGFVNDAQFAQIYFENLVKYKLFGYFGIKKKLMQRFIAPAIVDSLLRKFTVSNETLIAGKILAKNKSKTKEQLARMLVSRGFRSEVVYKVSGAAEEL